MHLVSRSLWHFYANVVSLLCDYKVVSFQVTDPGYQPSWQMKNNSAGAISPTSDLCVWDNSSLRFLSFHYCVLKGLTQGSRLVPLSKVSIKTCGDIKEVTSRPPQQCLMLASRFSFQDGKMLEKCSHPSPQQTPEVERTEREPATGSGLNSLSVGCVHLELTVKSMWTYWTL